MVESTFTPIETLTERETEVLYAMADGLSNQEISNTLFIALATVKWYNSQIYSKFGVSNRQEAVKQARVLGLLDGDSLDTPHVPNNLFQPTTPFIGRYKELGELNRLLNDSESRLITVLAPGGMGKTRLVLHVAHQQLVNFPDGVFFVSLAPITTPDAIAPTMIDILGLDGYDNSVDPQQAIATYLQNKSILLVMDNFEHLLDGTAWLNDILQVAPQVQILVSSRERLNLQGEHIFVLSGMTVPSLYADDKIQHDAIRLFVDSAQRIRGHYELTEADLAPVLEICELVEGMPLGIELAAGWMDVLSPDKIVQELRQSINILETDIRDIPERHRSIRATFDQSWQRITTAEQYSMMCLSIFRGGILSEAAANVAQANLPTLRRLVNKSLLTVDTTGRYQIHELLRQYCVEKLDKAGKRADILDLHAAYYAEYLEKTRTKYAEYDASIHKEIHAEIDNLVMAWEHIVANEDFGLLRKFTDLIQYLARFHSCQLAIDLVQQVIDLIPRPIENNHNLTLLYAHLAIERYDLLTFTAGDKDNAIKQGLQEIIDLLAPFGYTNELLLACCRMANPLIWDQAYYPQIQQNLKNALRLTETHNDTLWQIILSAFMAITEFKANDLDQAMHYLEQVELLKQSYPLNNLVNLWIQPILTNIYIETQKYQEAEVLLDECLVIVERTEDIYGISQTRKQIAQIALAQNDLAEARIQMAAILRWHQVLARDWQMLGALWGNYVDWYLMQVGEDERAVEVLSFVLHHLDTVQLYRNGAELSLETLYARMDSDIFDAASVVNRCNLTKSWPMPCPF